MPASRDAVPDLSGTARTATPAGRPSRASSPVARLLGDRGSLSYVCTARGHSWS
ncbi:MULTISPECIES: hypothetical protein [unclassified Streptomyces]|uniref:hypothetical protein n=1 Tax=unclassified Streptomyces TaxID=2593676 RepID=UPI0033FD85AE